jgi:high-affinity nickel-transport protein
MKNNTPDLQHGMEKRSLVGVSSAVIALHLVGWGALFAAVLPAQVSAGGDAGLLLALALSAYALGVRHAFDADHIAAIDNATRQLLSRGRQTVSTGFWFAMGHSSVVILSVLFLALGLEVFAGGLSDENSGLREVAGIWGGTVSGLFLVAAGALNLSVLRSLSRIRRRMRAGDIDEKELHRHLNNRGLLHRFLLPFSKLMDRPWKMYPVGFLFGLGLDTAASISLFVLASALAPGLPWYSVLVLPVLFTAGMTLFDSADGFMMSRVYRWASADAVRKVNYNLVVTSVSVFVAFLIGGFGLLSVLAELQGAAPGILSGVAEIDLNFLGAGLACFFTMVWLATVALRKIGPSAPVVTR